MGGEPSPWSPKSPWCFTRSRALLGGATSRGHGSFMHLHIYDPRSPSERAPPPHTHTRAQPHTKPHTLKNSLVEAYIILVRVLAVSGALSRNVWMAGVRCSYFMRVDRGVVRQIVC